MSAAAVWPCHWPRGEGLDRAALLKAGVGRVISAYYDRLVYHARQIAIAGGGLSANGPRRGDRGPEIKAGPMDPASALETPRTGVSPSAWKPSDRAATPCVRDSG